MVSFLDLPHRAISLIRDYSSNNEIHNCTEELAELCDGGEARGAAVPAAVPVASSARDVGVHSVAAAVLAGELPDHQLDVAAYEIAVLHSVADDAAKPSAHRQYLLQSLRRAVGLSRRDVSQIEALARSAKELELDFERRDVPDSSSLEYRLFLCRCAAGNIHLVYNLLSNRM